MNEEIIKISAYRKIDDGHYEIFFNVDNIIMADYELRKKNV